MHKVQKNIVSFLNKNIILAVTVIVLVTSLVSVSAMEIIAPEDFKPSKGVQRILNLDNEKNEIQIAQSKEAESESSSLASVSSSVMSNSSSQSDDSEKTSGEEKTVDESSSVGSSNEQRVTSSSNSYSYSASSYVSSAVSIPNAKSSSNASVKPSSSKTFTKSVVETQGSPLCRINDEKPEIAEKQEILKRRKITQGTTVYKKIVFIHNEDSNVVQKAAIPFQHENGGVIDCYSTKDLEKKIKQNIYFDAELTDCNQVEIGGLQRILQIAYIQNFECIKESHNFQFTSYYLHNTDINQLYDVYVHNQDNLNKDISKVNYLCDADDTFMGKDWVLRTPENDYMCATDWE